MHHVRGLSTESRFKIIRETWLRRREREPRAAERNFRRALSRHSTPLLYLGVCTRYGAVPSSHTCGLHTVARQVSGYVCGHSRVHRAYMRRGSRVYWWSAPSKTPPLGSVSRDNSITRDNRVFISLWDFILISALFPFSFSRSYLSLGSLPSSLPLVLTRAYAPFSNEWMSERTSERHSW